MFCKNCGTQNDDNALQCARCGQSLQQMGATPFQVQSIPNYLVQSILVTLCCCLPFGIVGIVYAAQVNGLIQTGNIQAALVASKNAKMWCWLGFGIGLLINLAVFIIYAIGIAATVAGAR